MFGPIKNGEKWNKCILHGYNPLCTITRYSPVFISGQLINMEKILCQMEKQSRHMTWNKDVNVVFNL